MTNKFKSGDKVRCVRAEQTMYLTEGHTYTVGKVDGTTFTVTEVAIGQGCEHFYNQSRFELYRPAPAVKAPEKKLTMNLHYDGVTISFDTSNKASRAFADKLLDILYV